MFGIDCRAFNLLFCAL